MSSSLRQEKRYPIRTLEFNSAQRLISFLLSAVSEPTFGPGSVIYERSLNCIHQARAEGLFIRIQGSKDVVERLDAMVRTGCAQATVHEGDHVPASATKMTIEQLMRRIHLKAEAQKQYCGGRLLTALWNADQTSLNEYVSYLWNLGANGMEIAFVRPVGTAAMPTHLVRIDGLRHAGAFQSWGRRGNVETELYVPMPGIHQSEYYVQWGWRFPVPGLDRLLTTDSALTLLRQIPGQKSTEWRVFRADDLHFFQKPHEVLKLEVDREMRPLIEMNPDFLESSVPLEVAIVPRSRSALREYWQIDREIDRLRRSLRGLEQTRARLVGREDDEVFFAYRFDQPERSGLNPLMLRLLQQRMGTLTGYDHAFCQPEQGKPFHLVIANRPSRALGFSLQVADRVYCQPRQWRNWGVNLYLPLETELAPLIDSSAAIPLLQRILENTSQNPDGELDAGKGDYRDWDAILWEPGDGCNITETRVKDKQPLLSRFRLLNSFQCRVARDVEQQTRDRLAVSLRQARQDVTDELDQLETELLQAVDLRTTEVETQFETMQQQLKKAAGLITQLEPKVKAVCEKLLAAPTDWVDFVRKVLKTHAELVRPPLEAFDGLQNTLQKVNLTLLKTLVPRTKNLIDAARRECDRMTGQFIEFDEHRQEALASLERLETLSVQLNAVLAEVAKTYSQIERRVHRAQNMEKEIVKQQKIIDKIDQREKEAETGHHHVSQLRKEADLRSSEADRKVREIRESEQILTKQVAELAHLRRQVDENGKILSARLGQLARYIAGAREQDEEIKRLSGELNSRIGFVSAHANAVETWERHRLSWQTRIDVQRQEQKLQIDSMKSLRQKMQEEVDRLKQKSVNIAAIQQHLEKAEYDLEESRRTLNEFDDQNDPEQEPSTNRSGES